MLKGDLHHLVAHCIGNTIPELARLAGLIRQSCSTSTLKCGLVLPCVVLPPHGTFFQHPVLQQQFRLKKMRDNPANAAMHIFSLTAYYDSALAIKAQRAGFSAYYPKPANSGIVKDMQAILSNTNRTPDSLWHWHAWLGYSE
jgi:hypothetical protein